MNRLSRRRFISISAAAAAVPGIVSAAETVATWKGIALGAAAQMQIAGLSQADARPVFARVEAEIERIENIFSLYRPTSALSQLNETGSLAAPPAEFLELLSLSASLHAATGGAFDPSVQPLWQAYAQGGGDAATRNAKRRIGWRHLTFGPDRIAFGRPGMALTLNGIAQGYLTDRVTALLERAGLSDVLVDMGEIRALGERPGGGAWRAGIVFPDRGAPAARVTLSGRALATSAPGGTRIGAGGPGHIIDPRSGRPGARWDLVSVSADRAVLADGLSTAFCVMERDDIAQALRLFGTAQIEYIA